MRKTMISHATRNIVLPDHDWLNLENLAQAEITSEDPAYPIESALRLGDSPGWRASEPGKQTIRLIFDHPLQVRHVKLVFCEHERARTQEFLLSWSADRGASYQEIVRQQYNFSPPHNACEIEEYSVNLAGATALELTIIPSIEGGVDHAAIAQFRIAQI